jgi:N-acetyl-gamma-glutamyl-phosphate reductase
MNLSSSTTLAGPPADRIVPGSSRAGRESTARTYAAGVVGASGTSGTELVRLLAEHPRVRLAFATSRTDAGRHLDEIDPSAPPVQLRHPDDAAGGDADVVFLAVPHGSAGYVASRFVRSGCRVIDLSGDHRLQDAETHARVYGTPRSPSLAAEVVYGLTELARDRLPGGRLVSNPGCYATAVNLALAPLAEARLLRGVPVIDAKSGVSGAGRAANATSHFCSVTEDVRPYKPGRAHRHVAEIEQLLDRLEAGRGHRIVFTPHLVPIDRGIEATIVLRDVPGGAPRAREALEARYRDEPFVRILADGREARVRGVARTNRAELAVFPVDGVDAVVLTVAIDNLLKGAAGQAVQNMNVMLGIPEEAGLPGARPGLPEAGPGGGGDV